MRKNLFKKKLFHTYLSAVGMWNKVTVGTIDFVGIKLGTHSLFGFFRINNFFGLLSVLFRSSSSCRCGGCWLLRLFGFLVGK